MTTSPSDVPPRVTRYDQVAGRGNDMQASDAGEWVSYEDHAAEVERLAALRDIDTDAVTVALKAAADAQAEVERLRASIRTAPCSGQIDLQAMWGAAEAGKRQAEHEVERLRAELDKTQRDLDAAQRAALEHYNGWCSGQAANALLAEDDLLWSEWRQTDITADDDNWARFTDRAHAHHDKVMAHLAGQTAAPEGCKLCGRDPEAYVLDSEFVRVCKERDEALAKVERWKRIAAQAADEAT